MVVLSIFSPVTPGSKFAKNDLCWQKLKAGQICDLDRNFVYFLQNIFFPQPSFDLDKKNSTEVIELNKKPIHCRKCEVLIISHRYGLSR